MNLADFAQSAPFLLAASISFSKSEGYPQAVSLARRALQYREIFVAGHLVHLCGFSRDRAGALGAVALLDQMRGSRSLRLATDSGPCQACRARRVLACYLSAPTEGSPATYCRTVFRVRDRCATTMRLLPCRLIKGPLTRCWHPARPVASQIEEAAAKAGVAACPWWKTQWLEELNLQSSQSTQSTRR